MGNGFVEVLFLVIECLMGMLVEMIEYNLEVIG